MKNEFFLPFFLCAILITKHTLTNKGDQYLSFKHRNNKIKWESPNTYHNSSSDANYVNTQNYTYFHIFPLPSKQSHH